MTLAGSGRGVRIAVIDSGINPGHPHIGAIAGGVALHADGGLDEASDAWLDRLGHGTAVTAAIQEKAPEAEIVAVRVFHDALRTSATTLIAAIDWAAAAGCDILNLSLGTTNPAHADALAAAVVRARAAGSLLVAAREAQDAACFPGSLPGVIGVGLDWDCPRETYRLVDGALFASGYPRPAPGVPPRRNLHGISFAVANLTGFVARACEALGPEEDKAARPDRIAALLVEAADRSAA